MLTIAADYFRHDPGSAALPSADCARFLDSGCAVRLPHLTCHAERNGLLPSRDGTWTTPVALLDRPGRTFAAEVILLTGCHAGDFATGENNEFLGIVRQLMVVFRARAVIAGVAAIPGGAAPDFADLVVAALTGRNPGPPWDTPGRPLPVAASVEWAQAGMAGLTVDQARPLVADRRAWVDPGDPAFWSPWLVVGDPGACLATIDPSSP